MLTISSLYSFFHIKILNFVWKDCCRRNESTYEVINCRQWTCFWK